MKTRPLAALRCTLLLAGAAAASAVALAQQPAGMPRSPSPPGASVFIVRPADGEQVSSPVRVVFGMKGMEVAPAGTNTPGTGHYHLIIDSPPPAAGEPIAKDDKHIHYGKGQTEATVTLSPGRHTLQVVLGDGNHVPHDPPVMSQPITVYVK